MEFLGGGDLQQRMYNCNYLSEMNSKYFFIQMVSAIKYCHGCSPPIVHRNLSPHNVLLASNEMLALIQIADFGLAKLMSSLTTYCGSEWYIALEMRRQLDDDDADPYTPAVDVWTLGVVLHYMLFGWHPACARAHHTGLSTSTEQYGLPSNEGAFKAHCETVSEPARSLIDGMMTTDVRLRHSIEEITGCKWFRDEGTLAQLREKIIKDTPIF
ncbi:ovarian-specific serine/threonine-protein kinase Lok-like [Daphnia pulex]|uniref:ovarian-specific serine/threonine-protein kinase Lok-like n=1 Tax=Daphnia pulex TaxID=6669 RepID=UPI001EDD275D|nr:ovarian-specific serine/threonine-protein kinase Lok-like [Daphnia pulex]